MRGLRLGSTGRLLLLGAAECALLAALAWWPGHGMPLPGLPLFGAAFVAYLLASAELGRTRPAARGAARPEDDRGGGARPPGGGPAHRARDRPAARGRRGASKVAVVWGVGLALRAALIPAAPELSDDHWRYLWDGRVQRAGVNPYLHAPADPALDSIRAPWRDRINNPTIPTVYPPAAQGAFALVAALGGGVLALKLLWLVFDLATGWLLARVAAASGRPAGRTLLLWLWSPLLVVETAWNAHLEVLGLAGMALLLLLAGPDEGGRPRSRTGAGAALAWASLAKFAPAAALPPLARRLGAPFVAAAAGLALLLWIPYAEAGVAALTGLGTYARHWRFNELGFALLEAVVPGELAPRLVAAGAVVAVVAWTTLRRFGPERALFWIVGAGLLLSPTLHPWYALWILPFAALGRRPAWLLFTGTAFVGYLGLGAYQETGVWPQPLGGRIVLWLPVLVLLGTGFVRTVAGRPAPEAGQAEPEVAGGEEQQEG